MKYIELAEDRVHWRILILAMLTIWVPLPEDSLLLG